MYDGDVDADALGRYVSIGFYAFSKHFKTRLHLNLHASKIIQI